MEKSNYTAFAKDNATFLFTEKDAKKVIDMCPLIAFEHLIELLTPGYFSKNLLPNWGFSEENQHSLVQHFKPQKSVLILDFNLVNTFDLMVPYMRKGYSIDFQDVDNVGLKIVSSFQEVSKFEISKTRRDSVSYNIYTDYKTNSFLKQLEGEKESKDYENGPRQKVYELVLSALLDKKTLGDTQEKYGKNETPFHVYSNQSPQFFFYNPQVERVEFGVQEFKRFMDYVRQNKEVVTEIAVLINEATNSIKNAGYLNEKAEELLFRIQKQDFSGLEELTFTHAIK